MDMNHSNSSTQLQGKVSQYPAKTQGHDLGPPTCMYDHSVWELDMLKNFPRYMIWNAQYYSSVGLH